MLGSKPFVSGTVGRAFKKRQIKGGPDGEGYFWGGEQLTFPDCCRHFVTVGGTGSGKSITLNLLMLSVLGKISPGNSPTRRVLVYDAKADLVNIIASMNEEVPRYIMNPMDARFTPWDIAQDVTTETDAFEFASILIPRNEKENTPYFGDTARALVAGVIKRFIATAGRKWTLRDLVLAFSSVVTLKSVLDHQETTYLLDHFRPENGRNLAGVKSTVDNTMALYRPLAARCARVANNAISLRDWVEKDSNSVIILGNSEVAREATDTLNRLILRQLSKFLIGRDGIVKDDETWIFLDELREAGAIPGLRQLLLRGRSKGVAVAMGFQDVEGIYAAYQEHDGAEIIGAAQNIIILHINPSAPGTTEWASRVFSSRRELTPSTSMGLSGAFEESLSHRYELVSNVYPVEFVELGMPGQGRPLKYYAFTNKQGLGWGEYPWEWLETNGHLKFGRSQNRSKELDFDLERDPRQFRLAEWDASDQERLGLKHTPTQQSEAQNPLARPIDLVQSF